MAGDPERTLPAPPAVAGASNDSAPWTAARLFTLLGSLGRLRVISQCGPSTFEALCEVGSFSLEAGFVNAITPAYHWHLALKRFRYLQSHDQTHARSKRRVLFFTLHETPGADPFLRIYVHREPGAEFEPEREAVFAEAHRELAGGVDVSREEEA